MKILGTLLLSVALLQCWNRCDGRVMREARKLFDDDFPRPKYTDYAKMVRWLVHLNTWGTLATINKDDGQPSGGVVSISDGAWGNSTGRILMYLTLLDYTAQNVQANPNSALVVSENQLFPDGCAEVDPENPCCARVEVVGKLKLVDQADYGPLQDMMFSRHPEMAAWPKEHNFKFLELHVEVCHLLDYFGGVRTVTADEYFAVDLTPRSKA